MAEETKETKTDAEKEPDTLKEEVKEEKELEEERRLLYVAITRAREQLFLYYTGERNRKLTRFLCDISLPWNRP